ncbi:hypothetical protein ADICEAN_04134 [Cesiribacter andamanensis AMV16]|uniref:Uncharacterized protein n=1 Tax=Cesiribacter andamanensis AMV16 TaxID=1279009 RepID=M7MWE6_9BACT|nr:hypothetical protein ADICEAN_04134 [Cesiribacter andamanensis AMV16]
MQKQLLEDPLGPFVIGRVGCGNLTAPVKGEANVFELLFVASNVLFGSNGRMLAGLDGVLLGRQAKGIKAHGMQHIVALHALEARNDIGGNVAKGVAYVQAGARGVGKHVKRVELGLVMPDLGLVKVLLLPALLPLAFNLQEVILCHWWCFQGLQMYAKSGKIVAHCQTKALWNQ